MENLLDFTGIKKNHHYLIHSSFKSIKDNTEYKVPQDFIFALMERMTPEGSIIMPTFTYNFVKKDKTHQIFEKFTSPSWTGYLTDFFRELPYVYRTSSPTHSFAVWGKVIEIIDNYDNPKSPLGKDSLMDWLANTPNTHIIMFGVDFRSLSFGHYLEVVAKVPWYNTFCWDYMNIEPKSEDIFGIYDLIEVPGCSQSFNNFENYLLENNIIEKKYYNNLLVYNLEVNTLLHHGMQYFNENYKNLLCLPNRCATCDERRKKLNLF
jgi:aminoglycoside N3'-acetyltransferase